MPKGTLVIRAAESMGVQIPRFCDHPLLEPSSRRQCIVEVEGQRNPSRRARSRSRPERLVHTQLSSPVAAKAQNGVMELLLITIHSDCPVCDKGRRMPAAEPGGVERAGRFPFHRRQTHVPEADPDLGAGTARPRTLHSGVHDAPAFHSRSPEIRSLKCSNAARCSRSASTARNRSIRTSRQHDSGVPGRRTTKLNTAFALARSTSYRRRPCANTVRAAAPSAPITAGGK